MRCHFAFRETSRKVKTEEEEKKYPFSLRLPLKIYKWSVNRNEFLWGFRHHLLRGERGKKKKGEMEKTGKLCLFEGKMLPISEMMKNAAKVAARSWHVNILHELFYWGTRTKNFFGCLFRIRMATPRQARRLARGVTMKSMMKRMRKCVLNRGLEPPFPGCLPDVWGSEWAPPSSPSQFHSGK